MPIHLTLVTITTPDITLIIKLLPSCPTDTTPATLLSTPHTIPAIAIIVRTIICPDMVGDECVEEEETPA